MCIRKNHVHVALALIFILKYISQVNEYINSSTWQVCCLDSDDIEHIAVTKELTHTYVRTYIRTKHTYVYNKKLT